MMGLEFLVRGVQAGHPGILLTFEEKEAALRSYALGFGWDIQALEAENRLALVCARIQPDAVLSGDFDLRGILGMLNYKIETIKATRILIDAPDVFLHLLGNIAKERAELYVLNEWLQQKGITVLMTVKGVSGGGSLFNYEFLEYMADCVIYLDQRVYDQITTRRLRVVKYRGSTYSRNEYPFSITSEGVWIIPVTRTNLRHHGFGEAISSGVPGLDAIIDGGFRRNSCTLITGNSGTGKTTFACSFVESVTSKNERLLYLDFEESWDALVSCMLSPGIDLTKALESQNLRFVSSMPESQGIEEHLIQAFREIETFRPAHLIVDAISACRRMGSPRAAFDYLLRLIDHCKQSGITTVLTNLTDAADPRDELTGIDLSSVIDSVLILRNKEVNGQFKRELAILKSRGRRHSSLLHEFEITEGGIVIKPREDSHDQ
jgi:circadian clock protein KaiC